MSVQYVLTDYFESALEVAEYEELQDGTFSARIPICKGVIAFAENLQECKRELRSTLEDWVLTGLRMKHRLPIINGLDLNEDRANAKVESV